MQAVSRTIAVGPACLATPVRALELRASTATRQFAALRPAGIFNSKSYAGRQLAAERSFAQQCARGGALAVEAKAVTVLSPVGDGTTDHLDDPTDMPGQIRVDSDFVLGRTDDRADYVLPVATVSGAHAKIEKKGEQVYITDLESTNGTYIDQKRISSNTPIELKPGSTVVFGDEHLAAFKLESVEEEEEA